MTISAEVDERTLREIHLVAFEAAVQEAGVWSVMTAYNKVNGIYCGEQPDLINGVLRRRVGLRRAGRCPTGSGRTRPRRPRWPASTSRCPGRRPGSGPPWPPPCATGEVDESVVDGQVRHVLRLMGRVGLLDGDGAEPSTRAGGGRPGPPGGGPPGGGRGHRPAGQRRAAPARRRRACRSVAVIGPNARAARHGRRQLRGDPAPAAAAWPRRWPSGSPARPSTSEVGLPHRPGLPPIDLRLLRRARRRGFTVEYFDEPEASDGRAPVATGVAHTARVVWIGPPRPGSRSGVLGPPVRDLHARRRRGRGGWGSRAPGGPCCASTARSSSTTATRSAARASTARAASPSR